MGISETTSDRPCQAPKDARTGSGFGQLTTIELGFLMTSHRPVRHLACPARFERATYALEGFVAVQKANNFNGLGQKTSTVQQTVQ